MRIHNAIVHEQRLLLPTLAHEPDDPKTANRYIEVLLVEAIPNAVRVDVNNVARYCEMRNVMDISNTLRDGDGLTFPWPVTWMEFKPTQFGAREVGAHIGDVGTLIVQWDMLDEGEDSVVRRHQSQAIEKMVSPPRWMVSMYSFVWLTDGTAPYGPLSELILGLDEHGALIEFHESLIDRAVQPFGVDLFVAGKDAWTEEGFEEATRHQGKLAFVALEAARFANCRNVEMVEQYEPRHIQRQQRKRGHQPRNHYVLTINPFGSVGRPTGAKTTSLGTRMHIRKGHFVRYGPKYGNGLLFGKHEGMWWKDASVVGNDQLGTIDKSYKIGKVA